MYICIKCDNYRDSHDGYNAASDYGYKGHEGICDECFAEMCCSKCRHIKGEYCRIFKKSVQEDGEPCKYYKEENK